MTSFDNDDPFSPAADPDYARRKIPVQSDTAPKACVCSDARPSFSRRRVLIGAGAIAAAPVLASAAPFGVPCYQDKQKVKPCKHKFCRHYGGSDDYYRR